MDWLTEVFQFTPSSLEGVSVIRAILGFIFVFFLPGFAWTLVFFSAGRINLIERGILSLGLSIALVTLSIFSLNLLIGLRITVFNSVLVISVVTIIPLIFYGFKKLIKRYRGNKD